MGSTGTLAAGGIIDRLQFSGPTRTTISATLPTSIKYSVAGKSNIRGYCMGGAIQPNAAQNILQYLIFSGETTGTVSATLGTTNFAAPGVSQSTAAYSMGGVQNLTGSGNAQIQKLTFSGEGVSTIGAVISIGRGNIDNGVSAPLKGYEMGGIVYGGTDTLYSTIDALVFSSEMCGSISATITTSSGAGSCSASLTKGYMFGGETNGTTGNGSTIINALTISGEMTAVLAAVITNAVNRNACTVSTTNVWVAGGVNVSGTFFSTIDSFVFSGETISSGASSLSGIRAGMTGTQI
jgi:filamentous hemagglutinin